MHGISAHVVMNLRNSYTMANPYYLSFALIAVQEWTEELTMKTFKLFVHAKDLYVYLMYFCWDCDRGKTRYECGAPICCEMTQLAADMILKGEY